MLYLAKFLHVSGSQMLLLLHRWVHAGASTLEVVDLVLDSSLPLVPLIPPKGIYPLLLDPASDLLHGVRSKGSHAAIFTVFTQLRENLCIFGMPLPNFYFANSLSNLFCSEDTKKNQVLFARQPGPPLDPRSRWISSGLEGRGQVIDTVRCIFPNIHSS